MIQIMVMMTDTIDTGHMHVHGLGAVVAVLYMMILSVVASIPLFVNDDGDPSHRFLLPLMLYDACVACSFVSYSCHDNDIAVHGVVVVDDDHCVSSSFSSSSSSSSSSTIRGVSYSSSCVIRVEMR